MSTATVLESRVASASEDEWIFPDVDEQSRAASKGTWTKFADEHISSPSRPVLVALRARIARGPRDDDPDLLAGYSGDDSDPELTRDIALAVQQDVEA